MDRPFATLTLFFSYVCCTEKYAVLTHRKSCCCNYGSHRTSLCVFVRIHVHDKVCRWLKIWTFALKKWYFIDIVEIWFGIANGQIMSTSDSVVCPPYNNGVYFIISRFYLSFAILSGLIELVLCLQLWEDSKLEGIIALGLSIHPSLRYCKQKLKNHLS